jgi:hypothetical protein
LTNANGEHLIIGGMLNDINNMRFQTSDGSEIDNPKIDGFDKTMFIKQTIESEDNTWVVSNMNVSKNTESVPMLDWDNFDSETGLLSFENKNFSYLDYWVSSPDTFMDEAEMIEIINSIAK